jgi:hypothetical protein
MRNKAFHDTQTLATMRPAQLLLFFLFSSVVSSFSIRILYNSALLRQLADPIVTLQRAFSDPQFLPLFHPALTLMYFAFKNDLVSFKKLIGMYQSKTLNVSQLRDGIHWSTEEQAISVRHWTHATPDLPDHFLVACYYFSRSGRVSRYLLQKRLVTLPGIHYYADMLQDDNDDLLVTLLELLKTFPPLERLTPLRIMVQELPTVGLKAQLLDAFPQELQEEAFYFDIIYRVKLNDIPNHVRDPKFYPLWSPMTLILYASVQQDEKCLYWLYTTHIHRTNIEKWIPSVSYYCAKSFPNPLSIAPNMVSRIQDNFWHRNMKDIQFVFGLTYFLTEQRVQLITPAFMSDFQIDNVIQRRTTSHPQLIVPLPLHRHGETNRRKSEAEFISKRYFPVMPGIPEEKQVESHLNVDHEDIFTFEH